MPTGLAIVHWIGCNNAIKYKTLPSARSVGHVPRFQRCILSHPQNVNPRSRKYLTIGLNGQSYQFRALPFDLATAPLEFTKVVKEVKCIAQPRNRRIHRYLDNWLVRASCPQT